VKEAASIICHVVIEVLANCVKRCTILYAAFAAETSYTALQWPSNATPQSSTKNNKMHAI
jgi:hypothetical protein